MTDREAVDPFADENEIELLTADGFAVEYFTFNVIGACVGEATPVFLVINFLRAE